MFVGMGGIQNALTDLRIGYKDLRPLGGCRPMAMLDKTYIVHLTPHSYPGELKEDFRLEGRLINVVHPHMHKHGFQTPQVLEEHSTSQGILQLRSMVGSPDGMGSAADNVGWAHDVARFLAALHSIKPADLERADALPRRRAREYINFEQIFEELSYGSRDADRALDAAHSIRGVFGQLAAKSENMVLRHNDFDMHNIALTPQRRLLGAWDFNMSVWGDYTLENFPVPEGRLLNSARAAYSRLSGRRFVKEHRDFYMTAMPALYRMSNGKSGQYGMAQEMLDLHERCRRAAPSLMQQACPA